MDFSGRANDFVHFAVDSGQTGMIRYYHSFKKAKNGLMESAPKLFLPAIGPAGRAMAAFFYKTPGFPEKRAGGRIFLCFPPFVVG
ncbi:MAG: hypothetical protein LKJ80_06230 [Oscillibacter sp.]|jgi:hypothetical protein|nr:hypothetical protein [Oscillibacter sp.]